MLEKSEKNKMEEIKKRKTKLQSTNKKSKVTLFSLIDENNALHMGMLADNNLTSQFLKEKELAQSFREDKINPSINPSDFRRKLIQYKNKEI